jgi:hypothetical protein
MSCKSQYVVQVKITLPLGNNRIDENIHCSLKKDHLPIGVAIADAFIEKYRDKGRLANHATYCPWHKLGDQDSCPFFESD